MTGRTPSPGNYFTDRVLHWVEHMRLAATVDAIDWANPVTLPQSS